MSTKPENKSHGRILLHEEIERVFLNFLNYFRKLSLSLVKKFDGFCLIDQIEIIGLSRTPVFYFDFEHIVHFSEELADLIEDQFVRVEHSLKKT